MRKFTKEQKKNIIQTKSNWKNIHTHIFTGDTYEGFEFETKTDNNNNTKYYRWNAIDQEYNIPIEKWQTKQTKEYRNYYEVKIKNNIIQFHVSREYEDYNKFTRRHIARGSRMHHTYYWNTDTDNIKEVISTQRFTYRKGKRSIKTNTSFSNHSLLVGLESIACKFNFKVSYEKWLEILKAANIKTKDCFDKNRLIINDSLIQEAIHRWNSKSNIKISETDMVDLMNIVTHPDGEFRSAYPYGNINSLQRIKNPENYIRKITKNYGKKIRKILYKAPYKAQFFNWIRKYEDNIDILRKYIESDDNWKLFYYAKPEIIKEVSKSKISKACINWLFGTPTSQLMLRSSTLPMIRDINNMLNTIDNFNQTNELGYKFSYNIYPNDLHKSEQSIIRAYNQIQEMPVKFMDYIIPYKNNTQWIMKTPDNSGELTEWGQKFHNCVGSYKNKILKNTSNIITMWDEADNPIVCIEVNPNSKTIVQAFEPCNKRLKLNNLKTLENWGTYNGLTTNLCAYPR